MRIDTHVHFTPAAYHRELQARALLPFSLPAWSTEETLEFMQSCEIDRAVLSLSPPGVAFGDHGLAIELARLVNEATAALVDERFAGLAVLPLPDVEGTLAELTHALDVLGLDGVVLLSNFEGRYLGDPAWAPLFDELDARSAYVLVHPAAPPYRPPVDVHPVWVYEFPFETTRAIAGLISAGAPDRWPRIRLQVAHLGGTIPFLADRLVSLGDAQRTRTFLREMYYDTALATDSTALAATRAFAAPAHVVFGSDWPYVAAVEPVAAALAVNGHVLVDREHPRHALV